MQNPPSPEFKKQAALEASLSIRLQIDKMSERSKRNYELMIERQKQGRERIERRLASQRDETVKIITQDLLDERVKKLHPALRPRFLTTIDQRLQRKAASHDAKVTVANAELSKLAEYDEKCLEDQRRLFSRETSKEARHAFTRSSSDQDVSRDFNKEKGRSL